MVSIFSHFFKWVQPHAGSLNRSSVTLVMLVLIWGPASRWSRWFLYMGSSVTLALMTSARNDRFKFPTVKDDHFFMDRALQLAAEAGNRMEVPVGAVLVKDGEILTEGSNEVEARQDALAHAEMLAIRAAQERLKSWRLLGTTLYVTKEPCPMCAGALAHVRVDRIVFGVSDPKAGACGGAFNLFELPGLNHRCVLSPGIRKDESLAMLQQFFRARRLKSNDARDVESL